MFLFCLFVCFNKEFVFSQRLYIIIPFCFTSQIVMKSFLYSWNLLYSLLKKFIVLKFVQWKELLRLLFSVSGQVISWNVSLSKNTEYVRIFNCSFKFIVILLTICQTTIHNVIDKMWGCFWFWSENTYKWQ